MEAGDISKNGPAVLVYGRKCKILEYLLNEEYMLNFRLRNS